MLFLARREDAFSERDHIPLRLPLAARPRLGHLFVKGLEDIYVLKEWHVGDWGVERLVFSPVRWQTWLQVGERCLDNTGLYKAMGILMGTVKIEWDHTLFARQRLIRCGTHQGKGNKDLSTVYATVTDDRNVNERSIVQPVFAVAALVWSCYKLHVIACGVRFDLNNHLIPNTDVCSCMVNRAGCCSTGERSHCTCQIFIMTTQAFKYGAISRVWKHRFIAPENLRRQVSELSFVTLLDPRGSMY